MKNAKLKVYRLEHSVSRLGPYEHAEQIVEVVKGIVETSKYLDDVLDVVKIFENIPNAKFAFTDEYNLQKFIRDPQVLQQYGFVKASYEVIPLYVAENQVVYDSASARILCEESFS